MPKKILIVDDERSIADNITYALETEGFEYLWCESGADAKKALQENTFDFIILDIGLPDINGFDLFKEISKNINVPIMFLTARNDVVDKIVGLELGADDYMVKPFSPRELTARIKTILRRSQGNSLEETKDVFPDDNKESIKGDSYFSHDSEKKLIFFQDVPLELSRYEYLLLAYLVEHPNRVYSRSELMERIWDVPESSLDRTVDTHIKTLRGKLKIIDSTIEPIVTHRGLGYSLRLAK